MYKRQRLLNYLENLAKDTGFQNSCDLAIRYTLLLEGTTSMTTLIGVDKTTSHALDIAQLFIDEAIKL